MGNCCVTHNEIHVTSSSTAIAFEPEDLIFQKTNKKPAPPTPPTAPSLTLNRILSWTSMQNLVIDEEGVKLFQTFCKTEFSDENIQFYKAVEEVKKEANPGKVEEKTRIIYKDFIEILAPLEISIDARVREKINQKMSQGSGYDVYEEAQDVIFTLMERDTFPRFLSSKVYKEKLDEARQWEKFIGQ